MNRITLTLATLVASTTTVLADPGTHHYTAVQSLVHLVTEPDHLAMVAVALGAAVWFIRRRKAA